MDAHHRKHNDGSHNSSTYHKKDGTNVRAILKREANTEIDESYQTETNRMNIYEWDGVLEDYTSGIIVVLAESLEEAYKAVEEQVGVWGLRDCKANEPVVSTYKGDPFVFYCSGGG